MLSCRHIIVTGRVQGVFFRDSTSQQAQILGLAGYVKNLPNGSVELEIYGENASLDEMEAWLWKGPIMAEVTAVTIVHCEPMPLDAHSSGFSIR